LDSVFVVLVKRAIPVVSPLMRGGATPARFPQWALMVGDPAVSSGATLAPFFVCHLWDGLQWCIYFWLL